ncbi:MAG: D-alanyl-D-alanine carboxypeptidase [Alphaproteobacteria bacterium]|nr:D-alanyl-D-alanine carboxypeptidase [Alphaproteobacteria bacterium]
MKRLLLACLLCGTTTVYAEELNTTASHALLMDADTGSILFEKNANEKMHPASMSKLMTAYLLFEALKKGQYTMDTEFVVSDNAWQKGGAKTGGSTMFLSPKQSVKIKDLLRGIIVQSGNDACIVVAEGMAGSEDAFAQMMNIKAKQLGLTNSSFRNSTGLPNPDHLMSAKDLAILAQHLINDFPEYYPIYSEREFTYNKIKQQNRNPLLSQMPGADGLKTGHTSESGYGLTGSMKTYDGRRLIMVLNGLNSMAERAEQSQKVMSWGVANFENAAILSPDKPMVQVPVWLGEEKVVDGVPAEALVRTINKWDDPKIISVVTFKDPVCAPIKAGQKLGTIVTTFSNGEKTETDLVAARDVAKLGYFAKMKTLIFGRKD